jgi:hypothetical protein
MHGFAGEFARILEARGVPAAALPDYEERAPEGRDEERTPEGRDEGRAPVRDEEGG